MITAEEIIKAVLSLAIFAAEIYFVVWTIKGIRKNKIDNKVQILEDKVNQLYKERDEDFIKMQKMQNRIEELEKHIQKGDNQK